MKILFLSDEECPALWDYYVPGRLADYQLIISCGDLKASYLSFLVTMARCPVLYVHGNHDTRYGSNPPEGCDCIDGRVVEYNGVRIMGLGGCLKFSSPTLRPRDWGTVRMSPTGASLLCGPFWTNTGPATTSMATSI